MPERIFLSFADSGLKESLDRIEQQAIRIAAFDRILTLCEHDLNPSFRREFRKHLVRGSRGYGYWCWKPQIILQTFEDMKDGDTLFYVDAGCHINEAGKNRLLEYFRELDAAKSGVIGFQAIPPSGGPLYGHGRQANALPDLAWTKGDLIDHLGVRDNDAILRSPTIVATAIMFRKCIRSMQLVQHWRAVYSHDFGLLDDSSSKSPNYPLFIEHRHDQACFSILAKLAGVQTISDSETWCPLHDEPDHPDWDMLQDFPIHAKRDKQRTRLSRRLASVRKRVDIFPGFVRHIAGKSKRCLFKRL